MNISIGFSIFFISGLLSFYFFDRMLKIQYSNYHKDWHGDGGPAGFFWWPKGRKMWAGSSYRGTVFFKWLFKNPLWAAHDKLAHKYLLMFRICLAIGWTTWLVMVITEFIK